jgi:hypothetical protein
VRFAACPQSGRNSLLSPGVLAHERPNSPRTVNAVRMASMNRRRKIYEGKAKDL